MGSPSYVQPNLADAAAPPEKVCIITTDGRNLVGVLSAHDNTTNLVGLPPSRPIPRYLPRYLPPKVPYLSLPAQRTSSLPLPLSPLSPKPAGSPV